MYYLENYSILNLVLSTIHSTKLSTRVALARSRGARLVERARLIFWTRCSVRLEVISNVNILFWCHGDRRKTDRHFSTSKLSSVKWLITYRQYLSGTSPWPKFYPVTSYRRCMKIELKKVPQYFSRCPICIPNFNPDTFNTVYMI